jgi:hypothetical protein
VPKSKSPPLWIVRRDAPGRVRDAAVVVAASLERELADADGELVADASLFRRRHAVVVLVSLLQPEQNCF